MRFVALIAVHSSGDFLDWFTDSDAMRNRTGRWYVGVLAIADVSAMAAIAGKSDCRGGLATADDLGADFGAPFYTLQVYTAGCYSLNPRTDQWESGGLKVYYKPSALITGL